MVTLITKALESMSGAASIMLRPTLTVIIIFCSPTIRVLGQNITDQPTQDVWLSYRIRPGVRPETVKFLSDITVPDKQFVKKGYKVDIILKLKYGYSSKQLLRLFRTYNPAITQDEIQEDMEIQLPAAPFWQLNVQEEAGSQTSLLDEAEIEIGEEAGKDQLEETLKILVQANPGLSPTEAIPAGRKIKLPFVTRFGVYRLRPEMVNQVEDIAKQLKQLTNQDKAVLIAEIGSAKLTPSIENRRASPDEPATSPDGSPSWPFEHFTDNQFPLTAIKRSNQVVLAVIDSGIALNDTNINAIFPFWKNPGEVDQEEQVDDDNNKYDDDVIGCTVDSRKSRPHDLTENSHGTHISGIASGRLLSPRLRRKIDDFLRLMIIKATTGETNSVPFGNLGGAIWYAHRKHANIINISLEGPGSDVLKQSIERSDNQLFVVAAGNGDDNKKGINLSSPTADVYPAIYAKEFPHVISVAAHDPFYELIPESNFGSEHVDIAAPGFNIKSIVPQGKKDELSGTSQAAPLVSLTAALIYSQGLQDPGEIKRRIIYASDYVPGFKGRIRSEGKLNIAKAVSIYNDVLELDNRELKIGRITSLTSIVIKHPDPNISPSVLPLSRIKKVIFGYQADSGKSVVRVMLQSKEFITDNLFTVNNEPLDAIQIKLEDGSCEVIPISRVIDMVPRAIRDGSDVNCQ